MTETAQQELIPKEQAPLVPPAETPSTILQMIGQITANPAITPEAVETVERLAGLYERLEARQAERLYKEAMAALQAELPEFSRTAQGLHGSYVKLEDMQRALKGLMKEHGFSFSFGSQSQDGKLHVVRLTVSHAAGHTEYFDVAVNSDTTGSKNAIQGTGSAMSYARRYLIKMALNIVEVGEDDDGTGSEPISKEQAHDVQAKLEEKGGNVERFFRHFGIEDFPELTQGQLKQAFAMIDAKR